MSTFRQELCAVGQVLLAALRLPRWGSMVGGHGVLSYLSFVISRVLLTTCKLVSRGSGMTISNLDDHSSASISVRPMLLLLKIKNGCDGSALEHQQARQTTLAMLEQSLLRTPLAYQIRIVPMMTRLKTKQPQETTIQGFCSLVLQSRWRKLLMVPQTRSWLVSEIIQVTSMEIMKPVTGLGRLELAGIPNLFTTIG